ncbi:MAG: helix-hairpin-helix domain-containing protein [Clostridiales bacterium]|nr:helix-hairpin-helix domain-containing protein [Clostridiales bacterium]
MAMQNKERRKMIVSLTAFVFVALAGFLYKMFFDGNAAGFVKGPAPSMPESTKVTTRAEVEVTETSDSKTDLIDVYICGQVASPGVYQFASGVILDEVIRRAGGLTASASADRVNLVYVITSNMSIYIPTEDECRSGFSDDSGIIRTFGQNSWSGTSGGAASEGPSPAVNINTASKEELMTLPGIGEKLADQIVGYREDHPFKSIKDICNVSGIGEAKFEKIKDLIVCL